MTAKVPAPARQLTKPTEARPYGHLPDAFLSCMLRRQHLIDPDSEQRVYVRWVYQNGVSEDLTEHTGSCAKCGTVRLTFRHRYGVPLVRSRYYEWPDGYRAEYGKPWDRAELCAEYERRHPISAAVDIREV